MSVFKERTIRVGDRVRKSSGKRTMIVEAIYGTRATLRYEHNGSQTTDYVNNLIIVDEDEFENEGFNKMKGKLFQTLEETPRFGIGLAVDSQGQYVLEMKNGGGIESFNKKDIEIVMPFTFAVKMSTSETEYQFLGKEGTVKVGDLLLAFESKHKNGGIAIGQVTKVNTKSDKATNYFEGVKIKTEPLDQEA